MNKSITIKYMDAYGISTAQRNSLRKDGFLLLPNAISGNLLSQWQGLTHELSQRAATGDLQSLETKNMHIVENKGINMLTRCNDLLGIYPDAVLNLLSSSPLLAIAEELCQPGAVPLQCDVLFKHQCADSAILWHQDALHNRRYPYLNIGIYLDDAEEDDGCLRYVPGTHTEAQDICSLTKSHGWEIPGSVSQPAKAGDILIQDMMVLHGSPAKLKKGVRRTIYIEMRPYDAIIDHGYQSREWAELRRRWMGLVKRRVKANIDDIPGLGTDTEEIAAILSKPEPPVPAAYCHEHINWPGS
ncbi:phytanoyl-CoA dioxygenase family protein [Fulvivirga kasyanovii]|uniref:Phytanoyl-CoA dioxygenase n=1 Tax=Fulvivirga kasyanovii TaxID=396812 RepID=A0ABW9RRU3_9BACT|nr:phytanoyl-CoA dioxygenase family protein [Fulvivirga kasyanovii]MTI26873.1 phytanoyl-CoA dioxygenase [Fulvivirga kasyanovii]